MSEEVLVVLPEIKYSITVESAKELVENFKKVPEFDASLGQKDETNAQIIKDSKSLNKEFSSVEKLRKQFKEPSLTYGRAVDAMAKDIQAILEPAKIRFSTARKEIDEYARVQEQKKIEEERVRVELIDSEINTLRMLPGDAIGKTSQELTDIYSAVKVPDDLVFKEKLEYAIEVYKDTMNKLESMITTAKGAEEVEAVRAEADKKHQAEKAELEAEYKAEKEAFAKEKAEFEAEKKAQADIVNAREEAERMRVAQINERALIEEQELAEAKKQELNKTERNTAIDEAVYALQHELNKGSNAEDIVESIINGNIPHLTWEV